MSKKYTIKEVRKRFKDGGCELLEKVYINNFTPMKFRCDCKRIGKISFANFKKGQRCKKCGIEKSAETRKKSYKEVKKYFKDYGCILLSKEYKNNSQLLDYICSCEREATTTFAIFRRNKSCKKCGIERVAAKLKLLYEDVKQYFEDNGCILLSKEYKNNRTPLDYICVCGHKAKTTFGNFQRGQRCYECGHKSRAEKRIKYSYKDVKKYFEEHGCILLSKEYRKTTDKLDYICICGHKARTSFIKFKAGQRCYECGIKKVSGENNWKWNPNLTDEEREKGRSCPGYNKWKKDVRKRDNNTCQICGETEGILCAHHIEAYEPNKELRVVVSNGILFCEDHHKLFHKKYGYDCNREQLNEFLKIGVK